MYMNTDQKNAIDPTARFRIGYLVAISMIALLTVGAQIALQGIFAKNEAWAYIINVSGKQRMLSQKIAKSAFNGDLDELQASYEEWSSAHNGLLGKNSFLKTPAHNSSQVEILFEQIEPHFTTISASVGVLLDEDASASSKEIARANIGVHEGEFLPIMHQIVNSYNAESDEQSASLKRLELVLASITILTLLFEAVFVFEPLVRSTKRSWFKIQEEKLRFDLAVHGSSDAIFDWNLKTNSLYLAPRFAELLGVKHAEFSGKPEDLLERVCSQYLTRFHDEFARTVKDPRYTMDFELKMQHAEGKEIWLLVRAAEHRDASGTADRLVGSFADITELKESQIMLRKMAELDSLTGLSNRKYFVEKLSMQIHRYEQGRSDEFAVLFLDFDRFKMINDSLGHDVGDGLLKSVAHRMNEVLPEESTLARFGGDEFAAILPGSTHEQIEQECERLLEVLSEPHNVQGHEIRSTASIGVVLSDPRFTSADEMISDADIAMYDAKNTGRGKIVKFDSEMQVQAIEKQSIEHELVSSRVTEQMHLVYQPIHDIENGNVKGFETLVRWEHPSRGMISPELFIRAAEDCGAIEAIGKWIFNRALVGLELILEADPALTLNINVSRVQLLQPSFLDYTREFAESRPDLVGNLTLEITETAFMDERVDIVPILEEVRKMGYRLSIDDFGTGYSSLSCLHRFPIDQLKIDRSFVKSIETRREFIAVFSAIVSLANSLDLEVVAEGIETKNQLIQLQSMDCTYCQGYFFAKPMKLEDAIEYLTDDSGELQQAA